LRSASTVSTNFTVSGSTGMFMYYGEPSCGGPPTNGGPTATVRFYFQTSNAGGFDDPLLVVEPDLVLPHDQHAHVGVAVQPVRGGQRGGVVGLLRALR
jgi:hypothetical protein